MSWLPPVSFEDFFSLIYIQRRNGSSDPDRTRGKLFHTSFSSSFPGNPGAQQCSSVDQAGERGERDDDEGGGFIFQPRGLASNFTGKTFFFRPYIERDERFFFYKLLSYIQQHDHDGVSVSFFQAELFPPVII